MPSRMFMRQWLALCLLAGFPLAGNAYGEQVAMLGDEAVFGDEFEFYTNRLRTSVASRLMREHNVKIRPDFWSTELDGTTPTQVLKNETLQEIARDRAIQMLAAEAGLIESAQTYHEIVVELEAENESRKTRKARGEVFYGPVAFRQDAYFEIKFDQLVKALERHESEPGERPGTSTKITVQKKLEERIAAILSGCCNTTESHTPNDPLNK